MVNSVAKNSVYTPVTHSADGAIDWLERRARLSPSHVALIDAATQQRITYAEWNRRANRVANALHHLGLTKGDRVAILAMNALEYLDLIFACQKTGVILQALNWRLTVAELTALIEDAMPRALVYGSDFKPSVDALHSRVDIEYWIALQEAVAGTDLSWDAWVADGATCLPDRVDLSMADPWLLCYTGGTTGLPKAAILTQGTVTWNAINTVTSWGLRPTDTTILNLPLFHTGGLNVFTTPLVHIGGCSIVCRTFDVDQVFDLIQQERVTLYLGVPTVFILMQQHARWADADFSGCRIVISGGASCPTPIFERFFARGVPFKTGYGLTEAGPNNFWLPDEDVQRKAGSVGAPLFHVQSRIVDPQGHPCKPGEVGELLLRGPHIISGYWNNPDATAHTIHDGWLHTGDLARCDEEGYFYIVGRSKDMIISGGENIYPAEVESVMLDHPTVAEAALIAVAHPHWNEVGRAIVVVQPDKQLQPQELIDFVAERLASYKVPRSVIFVSELPKTGAGKIDKKVLQEQYGGDV